MAARNADLSVRVVATDDDADFRIVADGTVDTTGASVGDVVVVAADGSLMTGSAASGLELVGAHAYLNVSGQTIESGSGEAVVWSSPIDLSGGASGFSINANGSRIDLPTPGLYYINAYHEWSSNATGIRSVTMRGPALGDNDISLYQSVLEGSGTGADSARFSATVLLDSAVGGIDFQVFQNSGTDRTLYMDVFVQLVMVV